jgi:hypothetical protein
MRSKPQVDRARPIFSTAITNVQFVVWLRRVPMIEELLFSFCRYHNAPQKRLFVIQREPYDLDSVRPWLIHRRQLHLKGVESSPMPIHLNTPALAHVIGLWVKDLNIARLTFRSREIEESSMNPNDITGSGRLGSYVWKHEPPCEGATGLTPSRRASTQRGGASG